MYPWLNLPSCLYVENPANPIADGPGTYHLKIIYNNDTITSTTTIPNTQGLDSIWFQVDPFSNSDSLGYIWAQVTDPDTSGNHGGTGHGGRAAHGWAPLHTEQLARGPCPGDVLVTVCRADAHFPKHLMNEAPYWLHKTPVFSD